MYYYKLIDNQNIIGVIQQTAFMKYQAKHNIMLSCLQDEAQYAEFNGVYYRDTWMRPVGNDINYTPVSIVMIEEEEYNALAQAFETQEIVEIHEPEPIVIEEPEEETDETLAFVKEMKLKEISMACEDAIVYGIDVVLEDEEQHHFSLDLESQINLMTLSSLAANGEQYIPYHADGELCRYFSPQEINTIVSVATTHKTFNTTYHNSLKAYVTALDNIHDIMAVQYGMEIPVDYQSDILKQMYAQMETSNG